MAERFLDKEGIPFVYDTHSGKLFRISGDKRVEITDSASAAHILFTADRTTPEEIEASKSRLRHTRSLKEWARDEVFRFDPCSMLPWHRRLPLNQEVKL